MSKTKLLGLFPEELKELVAAEGLPSFAAKQIAEWIYKKRVQTIDEMTNLSLKARSVLNEKYEVGREPWSHSSVSDDGTTKYLFDTQCGKIETVLIPDADRNTLCISCQVGCKMNCRFCMTGKQGWNGNLTATEILNQIFAIDSQAHLSNLVFMGMGEPFDNTDEILRTLKVLTASWGAAMSAHRITVSTVGVVPGMLRFLKETDCHLAISLHSPFNEERLRLMPAQKAFPIERVIDELTKFDWTHQRRLSFEYIVFEGVNDSPRHAAQIVHLLAKLQCRVNLIRFHAVPGIDMHSPSEEKMIWLRDYLSAKGVICTIRRSRGEDIKAACGLLSSNYKH